MFEMTGTIFISSTQFPYKHTYADNIVTSVMFESRSDWGVRVVSRNVIKSQHLWQASRAICMTSMSAAVTSDFLLCFAYSVVFPRIYNYYARNSM